MKRIDETRTPRLTLLLQLGVVCLAVGGCSDAVQHRYDGAAEPIVQAQTELQQYRSDDRMEDSASLPPVVLRLAIPHSKDATTVTGTFGAEIENTSKETVTVILSLRGWGLHQVTSENPVGSFTLGPYQTLYVPIALDDVPVQSIGAPAQLQIFGSSSSSEWADQNTPTDSMYVQFANDYSEAYASKLSTWSPVVHAYFAGDTDADEYYQLLDDPSDMVRAPGGGYVTGIDEVLGLELFTNLIEPSMRPRGRHLDEDGNWVYSYGDVLGGGGFPLEQQQVQLMEDLEIFAREESPSRSVGVFNGCLAALGQYIDSGKGEDYLNTTHLMAYPTRYVVGRVVRISNNTVVWAKQPLNHAGCAPAMNLTYGNYRLDVWTEMQSPQGTTFRITNDGSNEAPIPLVFYFTIDSPSRSEWFLYGEGNASRTLAVVGQLLNTPDPGLVSGKTYRINNSNDTCFGAGAYSLPDHICLGYDELYPNGSPKGPHNSQWKLVIGHEIGHSVERDAAGLASRDYKADVTEPLCRCDHVPWVVQRAHCLQSREHAGAAWQEGFAHFYGAKMFNSMQENDCFIGYYKDVMLPSYWNGNPIYIVGYPPVKTSCRTPKKWMATHCNDPSTSPPQGTEWDWMTFLWNIHAPAEYGTKRISMSDYYAIKKRACTGGSSKCTNSHEINYQKFRDAALVHFGGLNIAPKYKHIVAMGLDHGVKNGI